MNAFLFWNVALFITIFNQPYLNILLICVMHNCQKSHFFGMYFFVQCSIHFQLLLVEKELHGAPPCIISGKPALKSPMFCKLVGQEQFSYNKQIYENNKRYVHIYYNIKSFNHRVYFFLKKGSQAMKNILK